MTEIMKIYSHQLIETHLCTIWGKRGSVRGSLQYFMLLSVSVIQMTRPVALLIYYFLVLLI